MPENPTNARVAEIRRRGLFAVLGVVLLIVPLLWMTSDKAYERTVYPFYWVLAIGLTALMLGKRITTNNAERALTLGALAVLGLEWILVTGEASEIGAAEAFLGMRSVMAVTGGLFLSFGPRGGMRASAAMLVGWTVIGAIRAGGVPIDAEATGSAVAFSAAIIALFWAATAAYEVFEDGERQAKETAALAYVDELTRLPNRRAVKRHLGALVSAAQRSPDPVGCVLILDLDHFKRLNDTFGHDAGDHALVDSAVRFAATLRGEDVIGRWGGEEFIVVLPGAPRAVGCRVAERLRQAVKDVTDPSPLTVSIGVTEVHGVTTAEAVLEAADAALYDAKAGGRDRCHLAHADGTSTWIEPGRPMREAA